GGLVAGGRVSPPPPRLTAVGTHPRLPRDNKNRAHAANLGRNHTVAQTVEAFVGKSLDEAKISPLHMKIVGLIAAGYFFDVIDFTTLGSLNPYLTKSFSPAEFGFIGSAAIFGMAI